MSDLTPTTPGDDHTPELPAQTDPLAQEDPQEDPLRSTTVSRTWSALVVLGALLALTATFIAQNTEQVPINFFGWTWRPPLAAALLAATALGLSIALVAGSLRMLQVRRRVRKNGRR